MRRRIDWHDLTESTTSPHLSLDKPDPALYDELLWAEYIEARRRLNILEQRVRTALVDEPLDAVEVALGRKLDRMMSEVEPYDAEEWARIEAKLREHAATRTQVRR